MPRCCIANSLCRRIGLNKLVGSGLCGAGVCGHGAVWGSHQRQPAIAASLPDLAWLISHTTERLLEV